MGGRGSRSRFSMVASGNAMVKPPQAPQQMPQPPQSGNPTGIPDWTEAFDPGTDYERTGDVNHSSRTVSRSLQRRWDQFSAPYQTGMTAADDAALMKEWDWNTGNLYGYFRTTNSMAINSAFNNPANDGKTPMQIFGSARGRDGMKDVKTVQTLDKAVSSHSTQADAYYLRYCKPSSLQRAFGFTDAQMSAIQSAGSLNPAQLAQLNKSLAGSTSFSRSYTSTSANRSMNAFKNPHAPQSKNYIFERRLYAPKGTNAYAPRNNAQESEVLFGRRMHTQFLGITYERGHIVVHEMFDGYK